MNGLMNNMMKGNAMKFNKIILLLLVTVVGSTSLYAQKTQSDNGDGTYTNPVIASDFPDPDVILVDDTYYMVATTMFTFPGVTVIKSKDLVNWEYCSNAVERFDFSECYNLDECHRYGRGQWATSIKYHNGLFHLLFITLDEGGFICTAEKAEGPWKIRKLPRGFYDPGLFFDDDGRIYVAEGYGTISITEVDKNFAPISETKEVFKGNLRGGLEGAHVYKINGYYYLYCTYGGPDGFQVALRSKNIYGPYEQKIVIRDETPGVNFGVHQGALIQTQTGQWWTMLFVDSGPLGRFPSLHPVRWEDNWPIAGVDGKGVVTYKKPDVGKEYPIKTMPTSDEFSAKELPMQWNWNHNPHPGKWTLSERDGWLRLYTTSVTNDLKMARNSLTQRTWAYYSDEVPSSAVAKFDVSKMKDGDIAGFAIFQDPYAYIAVKKTGDISELIMVNNGQTIATAPLASDTVYLMAQPEFGSRKAAFAYSTDNQTFTRLGNYLNMRFNLSIFTGNKYMLFNHATKELGGSININ